MKAPLPQPNPLVRAVLPPPIPVAKGWLAAYEGSRGPIVDLSQAVPGDPPPDALSRRLAQEGADAAAARYGPILGDDALRTAYAQDCSRFYRAPIEPGDVAITAGCNQAFFVAVMAVAKPGDSVLLPVPWYFNHQMTLELLGIEPRALETQAENGFVPDVEAAEARIDATTRAIVLVSPNNPTGAIYPPETIAAFLDLCRRRGLYLILDETYRDFVGGTAPHALFAEPDWREHLIGLYSFSKSFAIPGYRLGAMTAGPALLSAAETILDCMQICAPRPAQVALAPAMAETADWRAEKTRAVQEKAEAFRRAMAQRPDWPIRQIGAYFSFIEHPFPNRSDVEVAKALAARLGLLVLPGSFFGPGQERFLRVAFANVDIARLERFADRLALSDTLFSRNEVAA
ncbi:aspartate/tyrosine/aromatic aminotransferase [Aureimonas ureilytica]|uniref:Aminotransferase n=1 Tax=Aureimonas ureilytica TaxID=401562 RepID=A0A175RNB6_9HYPH|nr:aminotransferase [Aureimonas ureilytica]KTR04279.1 aspartate/tyrosine/aromatic aminotransferase [Aureimonas ureilytica]